MPFALRDAVLGFSASAATASEQLLSEVCHPFTMLTKSLESNREIMMEEAEAAIKRSLPCQQQTSINRNWKSTQGNLHAPQSKII